MALANASRRAPFARPVHAAFRAANSVAAFFIAFAHLFAEAQRRRAAFLRDNPHISE